MNPPKKYVVSKTLREPTWRNTTIIRDNPIDAVRKLKAEPGKNILTDGSSQLVHALLQHDLVDELFLHVYPIALGKGKRVFPDRVDTKFKLKSATPYPTGVVGLDYMGEESPIWFSRSSLGPSLLLFSFRRAEGPAVDFGVACSTLR